GDPLAVAHQPEVLEALGVEEKHRVPATSALVRAAACSGPGLLPVDAGVTGHRDGVGATLRYVHEPARGREASMADAPGGLDRVRELGQPLRVDAVRAAAAAGSGHPTSSMSAADLAAVLLDRYLRCDVDRPDDPRNERLVLSKGHASPLL